MKSAIQKTIAVNMSANLGTADGLSHTNYLALVKILGEKYAARLVSSENLVSDFRSIKAGSEISLFRKSIELTRELVEKALSNGGYCTGSDDIGRLELLDGGSIDSPWI